MAEIQPIPSGRSLAAIRAAIKAGELEVDGKGIIILDPPLLRFATDFKPMLMFTHEEKTFAFPMDKKWLKTLRAHFGDAEWLLRTMGNRDRVTRVKP